MGVDQALGDVMAALGRAPISENLFADKNFLELSKLCKERYGANNSFALCSALRSLGLPHGISSNQATLTFDASTATSKIHEAFARRTSRRRYMCPLDLADSLPRISFGSACIDRFSSAELKVMFDAERLSRHFPSIDFEFDRFALFHWLVLEEEVPVDPKRHRFFPFDSSSDRSAIEPHSAKYPAVVENAIAFLLLKPWEEWVAYSDLDWRGFQVPWIYTVDDDIFTQPLRPPSPDTLTFGLDFIHDDDGDEIEIERAEYLPLQSGVGLGSDDDCDWKKWEFASSSALFDTPVVHFLVRAFLSDGIDEFLAHLTVIEAAFGLGSDHANGAKKKPDPRNGFSATACVATRLAAAIGDSGAYEDYSRLFGLRSEFVHGRASVKPIAGVDRVLARQLARRATQALVNLASTSDDREQCLGDLFVRGRNIR
ncbi:hypothetical protein [Burkholderia lata]|uniref:Apea-like HEPN domain-containing protein n=1 Tax=Burkholderia lata (strain ATCC 17760 / DSM 23089 / LMG 22485 / NCIMB 9086 / R18194 / 383) TaxID=482957 RepID=A0A6P2MEK9_BURL3|nr:hypothetical protein [Burkholderia lata]VWB83832.1 hypothetical protein BLA6863_03982 [Burkholderia lata]